MIQWKKILKMNFSHKKGITVLELLVVVAIIGIIVSVAVPQFSKMRENQILKNSTEDVISAINKTRSQTLASVDSSEYGVHFQSDKIIIFKGKVFSAEDPNNETVDITSPAIISDINFSGGASSFYFNRLNGTPNISGSITVSTPSISKTITISVTGAVSIN